MRLREIMNTEVVTIAPDETAGAAWSRMQREGIRHLVATEGKRLLGVLSERDLGGAKGVAVRSGRTVRDLMAQKVASADPSMTLREAANLMRGRLIGSLPVVEDGRVVGIVTATDVLEELGRGSSRPAVRAQRQPMRLPPASARRAAARRAGGAKRAQRKKKGGKAANEPGEGVGERVRQPDSAKRAPLPAYIRSAGAMLDAAGQDYLRRKLGRKLGKFGSSIERASVRVEDVNGPRGGVDKRLQIKVVLSGLPSVVVDERHHSLQAAMDRALARVERAVRHAAQRRRMKPLRLQR